MTSALVLAAASSSELTWPEAVVAVATIAGLAFVAWLFLR